MVPPTGAAVGGTITLSTDLQGSVAFNTPSTVELLRAGQNANVTFTGAANQRVSLVVSGNTIPGTTNLYLKKPDGTTLASTSISSVTGFLDVQTLPTTGAYSLYVDPQGTSGGNMTLTLYDVPPDVPGTIVPDGPPVTVATTVPGQNVNLTFTGAANQRVSLAVSGSTFGVGGPHYVYLKKPDGTTLASANFSGATGSLDVQTLPMAGIYTLFLDPQGAGAGSATLKLNDVPLDITGTIVPDGPPVTITTTAPSQNAILTFTGAANQRVSLTMSGSTFPSVTVSLNRPDGGSIYYLSTPQATAYIEPQPLPTAGTYSIVIDPQGTSVGSATFTLKNLLPDITGTIVPDGPPVTVTTTAPGQNAILTFTGAANQRVNLNISGNTIPGVLVYLKKPDGTTQAGISMAGATGFMGATTLQTAGTYSVLVDPQGTAVGSATLTLNDVAPDITGTIVPDGPPVTITTTDPGQQATLTFTGAANQRVTLVMSDNTIPGIYVSLFKPDTFTLASMSIFGATGWMDVQTLPTAGTYSIRIGTLGTGVGSATFTLHNAVPDITGTIVPGGPPVTATTTASGQNASLTFTGAANQRVSLVVSGSTIPGFYLVSLKKPDGTTLASTGVIGTGYLDVQTLPTSGTYSVFIDPQNTAVGGATVQLYNVPPDITGIIVPGGPPVTVMTTSPGQNATLTFTGAANQRVSLNVSGSTIPAYSFVYLLKPDGTTLASTFFIGTGFIDVQTLPTAGTYSVFLDPSETAVGSATLTLNNVP
jgi:uncharacterized protein YhfF